MSKFKQIIQSSDNGFQCLECSKWHPFTPYVIAHRRENIVHTCDCGATHIIQAEKHPRTIVDVDARELLH
jgi:hypothetical protein